MAFRLSAFLPGRSIGIAAEVALAFVCLVLDSFSSAQEKPIKDAPSKAQLLIFSSELFTGDMKRLEPHFGLTASGCFRLDRAVQGAPDLKKAVPLPVRVQLQRWEKGTPRADLSSLNFSFADTREVAISVRETPHPKEGARYRVTTTIISKCGSSSYMMEDVPMPRLENELDSRFTTMRKLDKPVELKDNQSVAVWMLASEKGANKIVTDDESFEQVAKRVEWALVLSVSLGKSKEKK